LEIVPMIPEGLRTRAGEIYYQAFERKLQPLVGSPEATRRALAEGMDLNMAIGVVVDGDLLGLAGLHSRVGIFSSLRLRNSLNCLGLLRGGYAWVVLNLFGKGAGCLPGVLRIAALAVDERARGRGLGSALIEAVLEKAQREGFDSVRLEVVDSNVGARRLYERMGFGVIATHHYRIPRGWLGFQSELVMEKSV